jgi:signal peptidase I
MVSSRRRSGGFSDTFKTVLQVCLIALLVRSFAYEGSHIPSKSMLPSLLVGDYVVISKFAYGYSRHALPFSLHLFDGRVFFHVPKRGDVVVFKTPVDNRTDLIKRLVGLPGDRIQVRHRVLVINGEAVARQAIDDYIDRDPRSGNQRYPQYVETLPHGPAHLIIEDAGPENPVDNTDEVVVPPHHYFMMGDNRDNSEDSRYANAVGFVPEENLVGRAEIIILSSEPSAAPWQFWHWPSNLRRDRFLARVL